MTTGTKRRPKVCQTTVHRVLERGKVEITTSCGRVGQPPGFKENPKAIHSTIWPSDVTCPMCLRAVRKPWPVSPPV